ncbi:MAG TPA: class I SAM-dependent methyltransferase [Jatrophihabitans sp.]|nr:class I SAM-dependent methyltransferase [Jatrophihabitans sp.]
MRQVRGKKVVELSGEQFQAHRARYRRLLVDVGTGDGKHAYHLARTEPDALVVGLDAAKDNLRKVSGRTDAANLLFLWAAVEQLPAELRAIDELHVLMPWGSLLRGMLGEPPAVLAGLAARCTPGARFLITLNLHAWRPPVPEVGGHPEPTPDSAQADLAAGYARAGWAIERAWYLDEAGIAELATSWTRRLNSSRDRLAVLALAGTITGQQPADAGHTSEVANRAAAVYPETDSTNS